MTHLYIELNGITEEVSSSVISKLYELASSGTLDGTSNLKGRLHSSIGRDVEIYYLTTHYLDLHISVDALYISFVDPEVERVLINQWGDGSGITEALINSHNNIGSIFKSNTTITSFDELDRFASVTTISNQAFEGASNLTSIGLSNIQYIGWNAFKGADITGSISMPNIKVIGSVSESGAGNRGQAFAGNKHITSVSCGPYLTHLFDYSFINCTSLQTVTGLDNLQTIGPSVFYGCSALTSVTGLSNITSIPASMFNGCTSLTDVDIDWTKITSIEEQAFRSVPLSGSITLSSLTSIGGGYASGAFMGCTGLTSVDLSGSTITSLSGTFRDCTNLSSVTLPDTLTSLESYTFYGCSSLQTIDLKNVTYLKEYEFRNSGLTSIDLSNIQHIGGSDVFYGCTNLTTVTFPSTSFDWFDNYNTNSDRKTSFLRICTSLTSADLSNALSIGKGMFYGDTSLTTVTLSASNITTIPDDFCCGCTSLSSLGEKIKPTTIGNNSFQDCTNLNINNYIDLSEVTYIGKLALKKTNITGVVTLPECVEFGESPFHENSGITELHCPKLTTINVYMGWANFANLEVLDLPVTDRLNYVQHNPKLTTINAPLATKFSTYDEGKLYLLDNPLLSTLNINFSAVTALGTGCFMNNAGLNGQYLYFPNVTSLESESLKSNAINFVFANNSIITLSGYGWFISYTGTVYVPDNLVDTYKTTSGWSDIANLIKGISQLPQS